MKNTNQPDQPIIDPRITNSMAEHIGSDQHPNSTLDWIDTRVYPRLQYRERYYNPHKGPFV